MSNNDFEIVKIDTDHLTELLEISRTTFEVAFREDNTPENLEYYINFAFSEDKLRQELENENSAFFLTKEKGQTSGYFKINFGPAQTDYGDHRSMEIQRIYVLQKYQGMKIGHAIINHTIQIAQERCIEYIWLGVWEKNTRAITFYHKHHFETVDSHPFQMGDELQTDLIMKRTIQGKPLTHNARIQKVELNTNLL